MEEELLQQTAAHESTHVRQRQLVGRARYVNLEEIDDLHVSPGAALAGKVYYTLMSQVTTGKKHGGINEVDGVVFPLKKSEISQLEKMGL